MTRLPAFLYRVDWGSMKLAFSEVTGLNAEVQPIEYREGLSPESSLRKVPGINKVENITLRRGVATADDEFFKWLESIVAKSPIRRDMTITLLNEERAPVMVWRVVNASPTKIVATDLKATGNETAIEMLEVAHEGISIDEE